MKIKLLLSILLLLLAIGSMSAQKVKFKKEVVYIDGAAFLKYEMRNMGNEILLYPLGGEEEMIHIQLVIHKEPLSTDVRYIKVTFVEEGLSLESASHLTIRKLIVKWMYQNKIFAADGRSLDKDRVDKFIMRYDEKISE